MKLFFHQGDFRFSNANYIKIIKAGEIMRKEVSQGGSNGTDAVFSLQYETTYVEISVLGTEEHKYGHQYFP